MNYLVGKGFPWLHNSRVNPWSGLASAPLTETHRVPYEAPFVLHLNEIPQRDVPSTVKVGGFNEVEFYPNPGEFKVDYKYNTGGLLFNSRDSGNIVNVSYYGKGSSVRNEHFNRLASGDPQDSTFNQWWRFADIGDHFSYPAFDALNPTWKFTQSMTLFSISKAMAVTSAAQTIAECYAYNHGYPGRGAIISGRIKSYLNGLSASAGGDGARAIKLGYFDPTQGRNGTLLSITISDTPATFKVQYRTTAGGLVTLSPLVSGVGTNWHTYTLIYSPGPSDGYLTARYDGMEIFRTSIPTLVNTATMGRFYFTVSREDLAGFPLVVEADYVVGTIVSSSVMESF